MVKDPSYPGNPPSSGGLVALKALAEKFRACADDKAAVTKLADDTAKTHQGDLDACDLCSACKAAVDGNAVRALCDGVAARK